MSGDISSYDRLVRTLEGGGARFRFIDHAPEGRTEFVSALRGHHLHQAAKCLVLMVKVGKKVFVFFGLPRGGLNVTCKLPHTFDVALSTFSFAEATDYGLGASGWVTATFDGKDEVPVPLLLEWIEESYRAVAPAKLVKQLAAR